MNAKVRATFLAILASPGLQRLIALNWYSVKGPEGIASRVMKAAKSFVSRVSESELDSSFVKLSVDIFAAKVSDCLMNVSEEYYAVIADQSIQAAEEMGAILAEYELEPVENVPVSPPPSGSGSASVSLPSAGQDVELIPVERLVDAGIPQKIVDVLLSVNINSVQAVVEYDRTVRTIDGLQDIGKVIRQRVLDAASKLLSAS